MADGPKAEKKLETMFSGEPKFVFWLAASTPWYTATGSYTSQGMIGALAPWRAGREDASDLPNRIANQQLGVVSRRMCVLGFL